MGAHSSADPAGPCWSHGRGGWGGDCSGLRHLIRTKLIWLVNQIRSQIIPKLIWKTNQKWVTKDKLIWIANQYEIRGQIDLEIRSNMEFSVDLIIYMPNWFGNPFNHGIKAKLIWLTNFNWMQRPNRYGYPINFWNPQLIINQL